MLRSLGSYRGLLLFTALLAAVALVASYSATIGVGEISLTQVWSSVLGTGEDSNKIATLLWQLRLPRIALALCVGWSLGVSGALCQGLFRNPLAEPGLLGISSGSALLAVAGIFVGADLWGLWATPLLAIIGALLSITALLILARGTSSITSLLLTGLILGTLSSALITLMVSLKVERWELGLKVMLWLMGSFEGRSWPHVAWAAIAALFGTVLALWLRRDLDLLHLGEDSATSLGASLKSLRLWVIVTVALLVGSTTALVGVIGFVALLVPHLARRIVGAEHGKLLLFSGILGALTLLIVDDLARSIHSVVIPPGVLTSLVGAPFFLWALRRQSHAGT